MKKIILSLCTFASVATVSSGCRKAELDDMKVIGSPDEILVVGPVSDTPYKNLVWEDEFNGTSYQGQDASTCFSDDAMATCVRRLDWDQEGPCTQSVAHLKKLNKCRWAIWDGFSFWEKSNKVSNKPSQVSIHQSMDISYMSIKYKVRPETDGPFSCGVPDESGMASQMGGLVGGSRNSVRIPSKMRPDRTSMGESISRDSQNEFYYNDNCKILNGGITSRHFNDRTVGRNIKNGRVEVRARTRMVEGSWPAIWMWRGKEGNGTPYTVTQAVGGRDYVGEIDILEIVGSSHRPMTVDALQTYHVWYWRPDGHYAVGVKVPLDPEAWNVYGVERTGDELKFYINGAFTKVIKEGGLDEHGQPTMRVQDVAEYLMLSLGITKEAALASNPSLEEAFFDVDWVRYYE